MARCQVLLHHVAGRGIVRDGWSFCILDDVGLGWCKLRRVGLGWDKYILNNLNVAFAACLVTSIARITCQIRPSLLLSRLILVH